MILASPPRRLLWTVMGFLMLLVLGLLPSSTQLQFTSLARDNNDRKEQDAKSCKLILSNHSSWVDLLYYATYHTPYSLFHFDETLSVYTPIAAIYYCFAMQNNKQADSNPKTSQPMSTQDFDKLTAHCHAVVIFPEATTSNNKSILSFSRPLPMAATIEIIGT